MRFPGWPPNARDLELFRTLLRLRYLSTGVIAKFFFTNDRIARRRLENLRGGFIQRHEKGRFGWEGMRYWRLTSRGIDRVGEAFPTEPIPNRIVDRLRDGSLHQQWEREELAQVYFYIVTRPIEPCADTRKAAACFRWSAQMRARADRVRWQSSYEVILRYKYEGQVHRIVPHATLTAPAYGTRVFIDFADGSLFGKPRNRLEHYARFLPHVYGEVFADQLPPLLLIVTRSQSRVAQLTTLAKRILPSTVRWRVALPIAAGQWLQPLALPPPAAAQPAPTGADAEDAHG